MQAASFCWRATFAVTLLSMLSLSARSAEITPLDAAGLSAELERLDDRVVLVNFWATWCRPCLEEIPIFMELAEELGAQGFSLVAVSLDDIGSLESQVTPFVQKWFPEFSSFISTEYEMDTMVSAVDQAWNEVLPTSYILARDGRVAERIQGKLSKAEFRARIAAELQD